MDFTEFKPLSRDIDADYEPLRYGSGYDQSWAIDGYEKGKLSEAGILYDPESGRRLRIMTTPTVDPYLCGQLPKGVSAQHQRSRIR